MPVAIEKYTCTYYITKLTRRQSPSNSWFTPALRAFRSTVRHAVNLWKRTHYAADWSCFTSVCNKYRNLILTAKKHYYSNPVSSSSHNPRRLWQTVNNLLHRKSSSPLPSSAPGCLLYTSPSPRDRTRSRMPSSA